MNPKINVGYIGWLLHDETSFSTPSAVCDINKEKVDNYCQKHPVVKPYYDYHDLADDDNIDLVVISTPNWLHCEMAELFLAKGKHVFCEKPMGINKQEMDRMLLAQQKSNRQLALDFEMRISSGTLKVKEIIDSGELGTVKGIEFTHHRGAWLAENNMIWRTNPAKSGGLYFMEVCHEVDFFRFLGGEIEAVQSFKMPNTLPQYPEDMPDNVYSVFFFANGTLGTISASHKLSVFTAELDQYAKNGHDMCLIFYGEKGSLRLDCVKDEILIVKNVNYPLNTKGLRVEFDRIEKLNEKNSCHNIDANRLAFIKACAENKPHIQDAYDAWRTHCVCLAAERSALEKFQKITIDYTEPNL